MRGINVIRLQRWKKVISRNWKRIPVHQTCSWSVDSDSIRMTVGYTLNILKIVAISKRGNKKRNNKFVFVHNVDVEIGTILQYISCDGLKCPTDPNGN